MGRRALSWMLALPLLAVGSQVAHALAYRAAHPDSGAREQALLASGHGYLTYAPLLLGACLALALAAAVAVGARRLRGTAGPLPAWPLALVPLLGFAAQEHLERLVATGTFPLAAVGEPSFLLGLTLQVPFGLLAVLLARLLTRAATAIATALGTADVAARCRAHLSRPPIPAGTARVLQAPLALAQAGRAPPR